MSIHNEMNLSHIKEDGEKFMEDEASIMKFWYDRKRHHTALYSVAVRVLAMPLSFSTRERVFSGL